MYVSTVYYFVIIVSFYSTTSKEGTLCVGTPAPAEVEVEEGISDSFFVFIRVLSISIVSNNKIA